MRLSDRLPPLFLLLILLTLYGLTLAPGLTWANRGADGGDLITAAATGGVPHPTGYPTYLLLARLFQLLPFGSLAFCTNLLSAIFAALASMLVYKIVTRDTSNPLAGFLSALAFGLSPLLWSQAVITEVYALHAFFIALILYFSTSEKQSNLALGLTFGLALGNHITTILLLPVVFASSIHPSLRALFAKRSPPPRGDCFVGKTALLAMTGLLLRLAWTGAGLLTYLTLPLRALTNPPVNWGNPISLRGFLWLVSARLYQDEVFALSLPALWTRVQSAAALLLDSFGIVGLSLSLLGLIFFFRKTPLYRHTLWIMAAFSVFALVYFTEDSYLHFTPPALSFSIWLGLGVDGLMKMVSHKAEEIEPQSPRSSQRNSLILRGLHVLRGKYFGFTLGLAALLYLSALAASHFSRMDASRDVRAEQFGELVMAQMPENTIVFAEGDEAIFALWYFHYALNQRGDLVIIATDLLYFDWYQQTLQSTYPTLVIKSPFPESVIATNPNRPACFVEYDGGALIRCNP